MRPSDDPKADELINSNISQPDETEQPYNEMTEDSEEGGENQNG